MRRGGVGWGVNQAYGPTGVTLLGNVTYGKLWKDSDIKLNF